MRRILVGIVEVLVALAFTACGTPDEEVAPATTSTTVSTTVVPTTTDAPVITTAAPTTTVAPTSTVQPTSTMVVENETAENTAVSFGSCDVESQPSPTDQGARIRIDSVDLDQPLLYGLTDDMWAPAWCNNSANLGQAGKMIVGGHRTTHGAAFHDLPDVEIGDLIIITDHDGNRYEYTILGSTDPETGEVRAAVKYPNAQASGVLQGGSTRALLMLYTCGPELGETTHRWIVKAELVD